MGGGLLSIYCLTSQCTCIYSVSLPDLASEYPLALIASVIFTLVQLCSLTPAYTPLPRRCPLPPPPPPRNFRPALDGNRHYPPPSSCQCCNCSSHHQESICIPTSPPPPSACHYHLLVVKCKSSAPYPFICGLLSSKWWLLPTSFFLLLSYFKQEKKHVAYLDGNIPPFCLSRHRHASEQKRVDPARFRRSPTCPVKGGTRGTVCHGSGLAT